MHPSDNTRPALSTIEPDVADRLVSRRTAIVRGATVSSTIMAGLRLASAPVALAALARDAFGQGARLPASVIGVLNYALVLEELEARFYIQGVSAPGLIPAADMPIFTTIRDHEIEHVAFLRRTLGAAALPAAALNFDYTARGTFPTVFTNYDTFKAVAQAFEDTGVRAYKGQAPALMPYDDILTVALTIHSVEARHAAEVRRLRGNYTDTEPFFQGWITGRQTDIAAAAAVYGPDPVAGFPAEDNTTHAGVNVPAVTPVPVEEITEAWDEPLSQAAVVQIIRPFLV